MPLPSRAALRLLSSQLPQFGQVAGCPLPLQQGHFISRRALLTKASEFGVISELDTIQSLRQALAAYVPKMTQLRPPISNDKEGDDVAAVSASLEKRSMSESFYQAVVPLGSRPQLRRHYQNQLGTVRVGQLLEDLDTFAVWLCYRHNQGLANVGGDPVHHPMSIVTACVDRIGLALCHMLAWGVVPCDRDIVVEGFVSWVGRSSMETTMQLLQQSNSADYSALLTARFVTVAVEPFSTKSVAVHSLKYDTVEEEAAFMQGEANKRKRIVMDAESLLRTPPNESERRLLHELFLKTIDQNSHTFRHRVLPAGSVWMEETKLKTAIICFPERKNLYGKIFGGFLMRSAFELAWANASLYGKCRPTAIAVDDIIFRRAVAVGSLLLLSSEVCFTSGKYMQLRVHAEVLDAENGTRHTTNTFHFTFVGQQTVHHVMPKTYADGMLYLSGMRHYEECIKHKKNP